MAVGTLRPRTLPHAFEARFGYQLELRTLDVSAISAVRQINQSASGLQAVVDPDDNRIVQLYSNVYGDLTDLKADLCSILSDSVSWGRSNQLRTTEVAAGPELVPGVRMWLRDRREYFVETVRGYADGDGASLNLEQLARVLDASPGLRVVPPSGTDRIMIFVSDDRTPNDLAQMVKAALGGTEDHADDAVETGVDVFEQPDAYRPNRRANGWYVLTEWNSGLMVKSRSDFEPQERSDLQAIVDQLVGDDRGIECALVHYDFVCIGFEQDLDSSAVAAAREALLQWLERSDWDEEPSAEPPQPPHRIMLTFSIE